MASISSVVTMGFGNGTFVGSASLVVTLGYGIGEAVDLSFTRIGLEYTAPAMLLHWTAPELRLHWTAKENDA